MALPDGYSVVTVKRGGSRATVTGMRVRIEGLKAVQAGLKALQVDDAPFVRGALMEIGGLLAGVMRTAVPHESFKVGEPNVLGGANNLRVQVPVAHPGARSYEFGRKWYYRGYRGRAVRSGTKFVATPGQIARPYLHIVKGPSVAERIRPQAEGLLLKAYQEEWAKASAPQSGDSYEVGG